MALVVIWTLAGGCSCQGDGGAAAYGRARERAERLLREGTAPLDAAFDPVLKDLDSVPAGSRFRAPAVALRDRLLAARALAPRPLARRSDTEDGALARKEAECVALAQALGRAVPGEQDAIARELHACRAAIDRYREAKHEAMRP